MWPSGFACLVADPTPRSGLHQPENHAGHHPGSGRGHGLQVSLRRCIGGGKQAHWHERLSRAELFCQCNDDWQINWVIGWLFDFWFQCYFHVRAVRPHSPPQRSRQWEGWVWRPYFILKSLSHNHISFCRVLPESALFHFFSSALPVAASLPPVFSTSLGCPSSLPLSPSVLLSVLSGRPSQTFALPLGLCLCPRFISTTAQWLFSYLRYLYIPYLFILLPMCTLIWYMS